MSNFFRNIFTIFRTNLRPYLVISLIAYGLFAAGVIYTFTQTGNVAHLRSPIPDAIDGSLFRDAMGHNFLKLSWVIFLHNSTVCLFDMVLPSLVIPFYAIYILLKTPFHLGVAFGPTATNFLALGVVLLEDQGYIFAALASYAYATRALFPKAFGLPNYKQGFIVGIRNFGYLVLCVPVILLVSAGYESWVIVVRIPDNPFPSVYDSQFLAQAPNVNTTIEFHGQQISYDSTKLQESDARIAQLTPHDVGYFGPIVASRDSLSYTIAISLSQQYWDNPEINRRLGIAAKRLKGAFQSRHYSVAARSRDSLGIWKERVFARE